jgi:hypothetical protein
MEHVTVVFVKGNILEFSAQEFDADSNRTATSSTSTLKRMPRAGTRPYT